MEEKNNLLNGRILPKKDKEWKSEEEYLLYLRHLAAYNFARRFVQGKSTLEIGCGSGYGTNILANHASDIVGVDVSEKAIGYCREKHNRDNLSFETVDELGLPFEDHSFDICVSFQVIEHINPESVDSWLSEIKRVLGEGGTFILTTPNRKLRVLPFQSPWNPHHEKEYDRGQLRGALEKVFPRVEIAGVFGKEKVQSVEFERVRQNPLRVYFINPIKRILSISIFQEHRRLENGENKQEKDKGEDRGFTETGKYGVQDFVVGRKNLENCLDLIGICKN